MISAESAGASANMPSDGRVREQFITFRLADTVLVSPLSLIQEVTDPLPTTAIGGTHDWFQGLASKKGRLVPVSDLGDYAISKPSRFDDAAKWLIVTRDAETVGLIVDEVIGLTESSPTKPSADDVGELRDSPLEPLITGRVKLKNSEADSGTAAVVDLGRLLTQQRFIQVGVAGS